MKTNRKQLLIVYICLALGAWSAGGGISFSQSNDDVSRTNRDITKVQHGNETTVNTTNQAVLLLHRITRPKKIKRKRSHLLMKRSFQKNKKQPKN